MADMTTPGNQNDIGAEMYALVEELYPICRSITGDGLRETLRIIGRRVPLEIREVPSGKAVLDWTVPREWNIKDAFIKNARGERVVDFRASNLHVVNYSIPVHERMSLEKLRPHLFTLPDRPNWIPYRTSYYEDAWGFCLTDEQLDSLPEGEYEVCIDSTLAPGSLTYGEYVLAGTTDEEILISTHVCHPSLCDDNLSGVAVSVSLAASATGTLSRTSERSAAKWRSIAPRRTCSRPAGCPRRSSTSFPTGTTSANTTRPGSASRSAR